jgi:hypothetical protein
MKNRVPKSRAFRDVGQPETTQTGTKSTDNED